MTKTKPAAGKIPAKPRKRKPIPKVGTRSGPKRPRNRPIEEASDLLLIAEGKLLRRPDHEIFDALNERRMAFARKGALERGATADQAEQVAQEARLSFHGYMRDKTRVLEPVRQATAVATTMLVNSRILELQLEVERTNLIEREAWEAYMASRSGVVDVEVTETVTGTDPEAQPVITTRRRGRRPEEGWLAIVLRCGMTRVELQDRIFELSMRHGLWSSLPAEVQQLQGVAAEDLDALWLYSLKYLYSAEAQIVGSEQALAREKAIRGAIETARQQGRGKGRDDSPPSPQVVELVIRTLEPAGSKPN